MYGYSYTENTPNCVGGIREFIYYLLIVSLLLALLLNTSRSFTLLRIICLVSTVLIYLRTECSESKKRSGPNEKKIREIKYGL